MSRYCTLFDRNYLGRGLSLLQSLQRHGGRFTLHVLCLDEAVYQELAGARPSGVVPVRLDTLLQWDPALAAARTGRAPLEFFFACKASLLLCLLERDTSGDRLSYLDSDLYFFDDPSLVDRECRGSPVALTPHRFTPQNQYLARYGQYNAGWLSVDASPEAHRFLDWWRARCLESTTLIDDETRFGDQKYLDQVPKLFPNARIVQHAGMNTGPWNLDADSVSLGGQGIQIEGQPLVFFHFHRLRRTLFRLYDTALHDYGVRLTPAIRCGIYAPYIAELARLERAHPGSPGSAWPSAGALRRVAHTARAIVHRTAVYASG
jgi:hypothetical protein